MKPARALILTLVLLLSAAGMTFTSATSAQAANCTGTLIRSFPVYSTSKDKIGSLDVYYSSANGGTNSACMRHQGRLWGVATQTGVQIAKCSSYYNCNGKYWFNNGDHGKYGYYAGATSVTGTASRCVAVGGYVTDPRTGLSRGVWYENVGCAGKPRVHVPQE